MYGNFMRRNYTICNIMYLHNWALQMISLDYRSFESLILNFFYFFFFWNHQTVSLKHATSILQSIPFHLVEFILHTFTI